MTAPIVEFVDVNVAVAGASATKFQFGALMGVFLFAGADRQYGPFFSAAEVTAAALGSAAAESWSDYVFNQGDLGGIDSVMIGREDAGDADLTAALDAIEAEDSESWYITNTESRTDTDILLAAAWTESRNGSSTAPKIYIPQSSDADILSDGAGNIAEDLNGLNYNRTGLIYHATDAEYLDGAWSSVGGGLNLDTPGGAGIWGYKPAGGTGFAGVPIDVVTGAEATNIYSNEANLYGRVKGLNFTSKGTMASGRFIDVTTSLDWLKVRLQESVLSAFVGAPTKIPYTNAGINIIVAAVQETLTQGVTFGHLSPDFPPRIIAPDVNQVSAADKAARTLTLQVEAVLAGAIQKVIINVNVTF